MQFNFLFITPLKAKTSIDFIVFICLSVRLSVCKHDNSKMRRPILLKIGMWVTVVKSKKPIDF